MPARELRAAKAILPEHRTSWDPPPNRFSQHRRNPNQAQTEADKPRKQIIIVFDLLHAGLRLLQSIDGSEDVLHAASINGPKEFAVANFCDRPAGVLLKRHIFFSVKFVTEAVGFRERDQSVRSSADGVDADTDSGRSFGSSERRDLAGVVISIGK